MSRLIFLFAILVGFIGNVASECANACSGHGKCTSYDMCICNRNWQANDCSERVCQYGAAHVDTPKGDLNMDGKLSGANIRLLENSFNYPYGTSEQFPNMQNSDLSNVVDSAHDYMECSNKGDCDRTTGECKCLDGYDGVACQRASCPNSCSGHGVCKSIRQLAASDNGNIYKLWDKHSTMGCECDAGFNGPDCSEKRCKHGVDPLYLDDISTIKYPVWNFATLTDNTVAAADMFHDSLNGPAFWAIRFFDSHGEDWLTRPIPAGASCNQVMKELYSLPNSVIPWASLRCTRISRTTAGTAQSGDWNAVNGIGSDSIDSGTTPVAGTGSASDLGMDDGHGQGTANGNDDVNMDTIVGSGNDRTYWIRPNLAIWEAAYANDQLGEWGSELFGTLLPETVSDTAKAISLGGYIYRIQFLGNPGALREPEIEVHLDGKRPSLQSGLATIAYNSVNSLKRVITKVWTDGQQGEDNDYFADHCDGVQVNVAWTEASMTKNSAMAATAASMLTVPNAQLALFKRCLGDADFDTTNNKGIEDWDWGDKYYPHIIKLVRSVTTYTDGGFYVALYSSAGTTFTLLNPFFPPDEISTDKYEVYTTTGSFALTSIYAEATFGFASKYIFTTRTIADKLMTTAADQHEFDGDISCETARAELDGISAGGAAPQYWRLGSRTDANGVVTTGFDSRYPGVWTTLNGNTPSYTSTTPLNHATRLTAPGTSAYYVEHCVNKTDIITFLNYDTPINNPPHINLYTAQRLFRNDYARAYSEVDLGLPSGTAVTTAAADHHSHMMTRVITTDLSTNWAAAVVNQGITTGSEAFAGMHIYKFFPAKKSTYTYVAPCSNRGVCDTTSGLCQCFPGYTSDACSEQSSLAI